MDGWGHCSAHPILGEHMETNYEKGTTYHFFTATHYFIGKVVAVCDKDIKIDNVAWIPDTGRLMDYFKTGTPKECEPIPTTIIERTAIVAATIWQNPIPKKQI